jgi:outer membrane protein with beta-barrel domain
MNKLISLLIILFALNTLSNGQAYYQFKGGYTLSQTKLSPDNNLDVEKVPGFHVGISFRMLFLDNFYAQTGLYFTKKGYLAKDQSTNSEITSQPEYLQLPLCVGVYLLTMDDFRVYLHTGPYVSIGIGGIIHDEIDFNISYGYNASHSDYDPYDLGIITGIGVEISKINLGVSYDFGLKEIASGNKAEIEMYTRCLNFSVGYFINK